MKTATEIIEKLHTDYREDEVWVDAVIYYDPIYASWLEKKFIELFQAVEKVMENL